MTALGRPSRPRSCLGLVRPARRLPRRLPIPRSRLPNELRRGRAGENRARHLGALSCTPIRDGLPDNGARVGASQPGTRGRSAIRCMGKLLGAVSCLVAKGHPQPKSGADRQDAPTKPAPKPRPRLSGWTARPQQTGARHEGFGTSRLPTSGMPPAPAPARSTIATASTPTMPSLTLRHGCGRHLSRLAQGGCRHGPHDRRGTSTPAPRRAFARSHRLIVG
jgi:hypothetical protein